MKVLVLAQIALCGRTLAAQGIAAGVAPTAPRSASSGRPFAARFTDVAPTAGFTTGLTSGNQLRQRYILEANGSGVALFDYDNDGRLDAFLVNGSRFEKAPAATNLLYRNEGNGKFKDVTTAAGLAHSGWGNGVCAGDVDNDGALDLYITYWGANVLYRNQRNGAFADVTAKAGVAGAPGQWATGCTFLDFDRDGHLDLFFATYAGFDPVKTPLPGAFPYCTWKGAPVFCGPRGLPTGTATLFRNRGDGTFEDVSVKSGIRAASGFYAFTTIATDLDGDTWPDIYVACDSTPSLFFRNNRDGTFTELATEAGLAFNEHGAEQAGMGLALADLDHDGRLDILKTNFSGDYPNLYRNLGRGIFSDTPLRAGLAVNPNYVLWGTGFADFDNDGERDLFQAAGHVFLDVQKIDARESFRQRRLLYRNLGQGRFEDVSAQAGPGVATPHSSRGTAFGDFDNDGDIDVLIMNMHEAPSLLRNDLPAGAGHWVKLELAGKCMGAIVTVEFAGRRQTDVLLSQSSFLSVNDPRLHFGLGAAARVDRITVRWPSGVTEQFPGVAAGALYRLVEGSGVTQVRPLPR